MKPVSQVRVCFFSPPALTFSIRRILRGNDEPEAFSWLPPQLHVEPAQRPSLSPAVPLYGRVGPRAAARFVLQAGVDPVVGFHRQRHWNRLQEAGALDERGALQGRGGRVADGGAGKEQHFRQHRGDVGTDGWRRRVEERRREPRIRPGGDG